MGIDSIRAFAGQIFTDPETLPILWKMLWVTAARYLVIAGLAFAVFYLLFKGRYIKAKIQNRLAKKADFWREIGHSLSSSVVFALVALTIFFSPIAKHILFYEDMNAYALWWIPVSFLLSMAIHDTYFYWLHRVMHHPAIFRKIHLIHHKSTNPSPWASYSFHLAESFLEALVLLVLMLILPMHSIAIAAFVIVGLFINVYGHLGYEITPRWFRHSFLFELMNTSMHHNLHHSKFKGNYGLYFRFWDKVCGTEHPDYVKEFDRMQEQRFGAEVAKEAKEVVMNPTTRLRAREMRA